MIRTGKMEFFTMST